MLKVLFKLIFGSSLLFLAVFLWAVTIGQTIHYEFSDYKIAGDFYNIIFGGAPIAFLLTLFGTIKNHHDKIRKSLTIFATVGLALLLLCF